MATDVFIFNKADRTYVENYWPIFLLFVFSKILDKLVYKRIIKHISANDNLRNARHRFCLDRFTESVTVQSWRSFIWKLTINFKTKTKNWQLICLLMMEKIVIVLLKTVLHKTRVDTSLLKSKFHIFFYF